MRRGQSRRDSGSVTAAFDLYSRDDEATQALYRGGAAGIADQRDVPVGRGRRGS